MFPKAEYLFFSQCLTGQMLMIHPLTMTGCRCSAVL